MIFVSIVVKNLDIRKGVSYATKEASRCYGQKILATLP